MEIKTEADDVDEGVSLHDLRPTLMSNVSVPAQRWSSPHIRKKLNHMKSFSKSQ